MAQTRRMNGFSKPEYEELLQELYKHDKEMYRLDLVQGYGMQAIGLGLAAVSSYEIAQNAGLGSWIGVICGIGFSAVGGRVLQKAEKPVKPITIK